MVASISSELEPANINKNQLSKHIKKKKKVPNISAIIHYVITPGWTGVSPAHKVVLQGIYFLLETEKTKLMLIVRIFKRLG